jgi:hypothetical protein
LHESINELPDNGEGSKGLVFALVPETWLTTEFMPDFLVSKKTKDAVTVFQVRRLVVLQASALPAPL